MADVGIEPTEPEATALQAAPLPLGTLRLGVTEETRTPGLRVHGPPLYAAELQPPWWAQQDLNLRCRGVWTRRSAAELCARVAPGGDITSRSQGPGALPGTRTPILRIRSAALYPLS